MSYQRAFSSLGCPELTLSQALELATRHGLEAIELRALGGTLDIPDYLLRNFGTPDALAERLRGSTVRIVAFDTSLSLIGNSSADREKFLEFVPWAEKLGTRWLRVFDGGIRSETHVPEEGIDTIRWWQDLRHQRGWQVDCMVETHDSLLNAAQISRFIDAAPGTAILWDTHHTWRLGGEDPLVTWRAIQLHVVHVHVKDSINQPNDQNPHTYVLPGQGEFPMASLVDVLREEFSGIVSLECERLWHPYLPPLDTALSTAMATSWW